MKSFETLHCRRFKASYTTAKPLFTNCLPVMWMPVASTSQAKKLDHEMGLYRSRVSTDLYTRAYNGILDKMSSQRVPGRVPKWLINLLYWHARFDRLEHMYVVNTSSVLPLEGEEINIAEQALTCFLFGTSQYFIISKLIAVRACHMQTMKLVITNYTAVSKQSCNILNLYKMVQCNDWCGKFNL